MNTLTGKKLRNLHIEVSPKIYPGDFDGFITMYDMASRIAADMRFEERCKRNAQDRERRETYAKQIRI